MQDLRYAFRTLRKQPGFTLVAILTLTLGVGANTAIFSVLYQALLRPLPYAQADRLAFVWNVYAKAGAELGDVSIPDYLDRRTQAPAIEDATLFTARDAALSLEGRPEQVIALAVTPSFFSTLGRSPALGRAFTESDVSPTAANAVIVTDALWRSHFGADPQIVGRAVRVNGEMRTVVGVLPRDFEIPWRDAALLVPFAFTPEQRSDLERGNEFSTMIARLRPGATVAQVNAQMQTIVQRLMITVPRRAAYMLNSGFGGVAVPIRDQLAQKIRTPLYVVQAAVVVVLVIACVNVANLLLMRATGRQRELAIRSALGAGAGRIVRQLLVEGLVLSFAGGLLGTGVGVLGLRALIRMTAGQLPNTLEPSLHVPVLLVTLGICTVAGAIFGLVPALTILRDRPPLAEDSGRSTASRAVGTVRFGLAIAETALAVVLLVAAGLLVESFTRLSHVDAGFAPDHVLTARLALPASRYRDVAALRTFWARLEARLREVPGTTAGMVSELPLSGDLNAGTFTVVGRALGSAERPPHAFQDCVAGEYFGALRVPLLEGRFFDARDSADAPRVAIVDAALAHRSFPNGRAIGEQLNFGSARNYTIVGVVGTINATDLAQPVAEGRIYLAATQVTPPVMSVVIRTPGEPEQMAAQLRAIVQSLDPDEPVARVRSMAEWVARSLQPRRTPTAVMTVFGGVALLLSAIGLYGVLAFGVAQRLREFGIRQALGATRGAILTLVFAQGVRTAGTGIVLGLAGAVALTRYLQSLLFGVSARDLTVFASATIVLGVVAAIACYVPAARATHADPMLALRDGM